MSDLVTDIERLAAMTDLYENAAAERDLLLRFAGNVLREHRTDMGDVDGGDVQDFAIASSLLTPFNATEPCGENCDCAGATDFPTVCFRYSALGLAAVNAAKD